MHADQPVFQANLTSPTVADSCNHSFGSAFVDTLANGTEVLWVFGSSWYRAQLPVDSDDAHSNRTNGQLNVLEEGAGEHTLEGRLSARSGWGGTCGDSGGSNCSIGSFRTTDPTFKSWTQGVALKPGRSDTRICRVPNRVLIRIVCSSESCSSESCAHPNRVLIRIVCSSESCAHDIRIFCYFLLAGEAAPPHPLRAFARLHRHTHKRTGIVERRRLRSAATIIIFKSWLASGAEIHFWLRELRTGRSSWNMDVSFGKPNPDGTKTYVMAIEQQPLPGAPAGSSWTSYVFTVL
jgi:hypothetical protein